MQNKLCILFVRNRCVDFPASDRMQLAELHTVFFIEISVQILNLLTNRNQSFMSVADRLSTNWLRSLVRGVTIMIEFDKC